MRDLLEEQAALYNLGLLEPTEVADFEARLDSEPLLVEVVREFLELQALLLALGAQQASYYPSPVLKRRILAQITTHPQQRKGSCMQNPRAMR